MSKHKFYIVDVFNQGKYSGNQLAVVIPATKLSDEEMQIIAKEFNFSETTFIISNEMKEGGYDVRIFTPEAEVPFAGHPTLGTAFIIKTELLASPPEKIVLNLKAGKVPVFPEIKDGNEILTMQQLQPEFGKIYDGDKAAKLLNITPEGIDDRYPVQIVSTGLPFVIIPIKDLATIKKAKVNLDYYPEFFKNENQEIVLLFTPETYEDVNHLNARMFADIHSIPEDPATGSANGCLAAYLTNYEYFNDNKINIRVEQGYEIKRKSLLFLKAEKKEASYDIFVGGRVTKVAEGYLC